MALVRVTQYNCSSTLCYGVGDANHQAAIQLQRAINGSMKAMGSSTRIKEDGAIGPATVAALQSLAKSLKGNPTLQNMATSGMDPKEYAMKYAYELSSTLPNTVAAVAAAITDSGPGRVTTGVSASIPPIQSTGVLTTAFDNFTKIIREATAASHGAAPSPVNTTPPLPGVTAPPMTTAMPSGYTSNQGMSLGAKVALGAGGVAAIGLAVFMLTKK